MSDAEAISQSKARFIAWRRDNKDLAIIYPNYRQPQLRTAALMQDACTLAEAYLDEEVDRAYLESKKKPVTELDLVALGFSLSRVDSNDSVGAANKYWSWQIYDRHYSPYDDEPHSRIVVAVENGGCTLWLESYDVDGKTLALTELQRKNWTRLQVEELINSFKE